MTKNIKLLGREKLKPTVYGWGINDVDYNVTKTKLVAGKRKIIRICPYYWDWVKMIERCFDTKTQEKYPTYKGCTICEEWKYLSNFIKWVDSQPNRDWMNCSLDKDILLVDCNIYSPDTTTYIPSSLNVFLTSRKNARGLFLLGVSKSQNGNKPYRSSCSNPFSGKQESLGVFSTELEAHKAWQAKKHEHALQLAELQEDERVAKALRERYAPDKDWTKV